MLKQTKKNLFKQVMPLMMAIFILMSSILSAVEVNAAGVPAPTIDKVFYDATEISGGGVQRARVSGRTVRGTIHVTLKNGNTEKASSVINPTTSKWSYKLPEDVTIAEGDVVEVYQEFDGGKSPTVTANAEPSMANKYKNDLKMPSGDFWLEQYSSNILSGDEKTEAKKMLLDANQSFSDKITSVEVTIKGIENAKKAYYTVTYEDKSKSEEIVAPNLVINKVTEKSAYPTIEKVQVTDNQIVLTLDKEVAADTKFYFIKNFTDGEDKNFCPDGNCSISKSTKEEVSKAVSINGKKVTFSVNTNNDLTLGQNFGIIVKEAHKFSSCAISAPVITVPEKVAVKDPKKLKPEEKQIIADAIRKANTTSSGKSKLPNGTGYKDGIPAFIEISDDGKVKVISPNDVEGAWDDKRNFTPKTNEDGTVVVSSGKEGNTIPFDKPEKLVTNLAPDTPKMENKGGNVVVTPNIEIDTDANKVVVEYEGADGSKKTITATKTDTGWTTDNDGAKVDEKGVVSFPAKEVKSGTTVKAYVVDEGGLTPEEKAADSAKAELKVENKYKITYNPNGGEGTMPAEEVIVGSKYRIKDNEFTAPAEKEFDHWMIGFEPKNSGDDAEVNSDIVIKATWKYIINPKVEQIVTTLKHPVNYEMYKKAISGFPSALTVEHIEVKNAPDITKVGGTSAEIEIRFSDGQFRTVTVPVDVKPDPKDKTIEGLNKDIEDLNKKNTNLNNTIIEKDGKIEELNGKITELDKQLKACQEQCAKDKTQCEKDKQALRDQIAELEKAKSNLEIQVKENRELIEQLRKQITSLEKQVEDWKKVAGEKDIKIKELENSIKELNTKLETTNKANTELKEKLATANQKILDLESRVTDLEGQVKDLTKKLNTKETEIKTLNDTITTLKEKIATLEAEKTKNKEAYDKEKANLESQIQEAKETLAAKEKELDNVKTELEQAKKDLSAEKTKTSGLTEQVNAKGEMIVKLNKDIEELKAQLKTAGEGNTKVVEKYETTIKEKETLIEKLTSEKAELEKQLAAEKAKNELLGKQIADLNTKADKAAEDLKTANGKITDLEKQLATEKEKNKSLTEQLNKITTDLENKTKEVETLNGTVTDLKGQLAKITAEQAKDKEACEKAKAALQEKLDKANQELTTKNTELDKIKAELEQAKKDLAEEKTKTAGLTEKQKAQEEKITGLDEQLKALQGKLDKAAEDLKAANDRILELEKQITEKETENKSLTEQVEKLGKDLETKTTEVNSLNAKITELEKQVSEKTAQGVADKAEIERLKAELKDIKDKLQAKSNEADNLSKEIVTLKETIAKLEGEKTELTKNVTRLEKEVKELQGKLETANNKIIELEKENAGLKADKKALTDKVAELGEKVKKAEDENTALKTKIDELNAKIAELSKSQCDAEELNRLKQEKAALEATVKGKDGLIQELRNQITDLKNQLKASSEELAALKPKVKELEGKINTLTTENTTLKEQLATANAKISTLEQQLTDEKAKNEGLERDKANLEKDKANLQKALKKSEEDKTKLQNEKDALVAELNKLKEDLNKCPAGSDSKIKELEEKIAEQEKLIEKKDKEITEKDTLNNSLKKQLDEANKKIKELESAPSKTEKEYVYVNTGSWGTYQTERDNSNLTKENKDLKNEISALKDSLKYANRSQKEKYVTIFDLNSFLYKTYVGDELLTQAEMTDFNGYIKPFIEKNRTMLPIRYASRSLGIDVQWDNKTRTATFTNSGRNNVLKPGKVTINADTLEMKDQNGKIIVVDSKPMIKGGRFYVSLTNLTKAFGGSNGSVNDGINNTIEWNQNTKQVLVYKYVR